MIQQPDGVGQHCCPTPYDTLKVQVVSGTTTTTLRTFSNVGTSATYTHFSHSLLATGARPSP